MQRKDLCQLAQCSFHFPIQHPCPLNNMCLSEQPIVGNRSNGEIDQEKTGPTVNQWGRNLTE